MTVTGAVVTVCVVVVGLRDLCLLETVVVTVPDGSRIIIRETAEPLIVVVRSGTGLAGSIDLLSFGVLYLSAVVTYPSGSYDVLEDIRKKEACFLGIDAVFERF